MISVDDRIGSIELLPILQSLSGVLCKSIPVPPICADRLLSGDVSFEGDGPQSQRLIIGVERKRLKDMLNSIRSGRYSGHQLPEMLQYYDHSYLFIEGIWRCGMYGELETLITSSHPQNPTFGGRWLPLQTGSVSYRFTELDHFICSMQSHTNVHVRTSSNEYETSAQIISLYSHYQKPWDKHHSHQAIHIPQTTITIGKASLVRRVASLLNKIGWEKSAGVDLKFRSVKDMVDAEVEEWKTIDGIGPTIARRAYDQLRGIFKDPSEGI